MITNKEVVNFAAGNTDFYEASMSYFTDKNAQTAENKALMQEAWFAEVARKSGVSRTGLDVDAWANHPSVQWAAMSIVDADIVAILPSVVLPQFNVFADFKTVQRGDIVKFRLMPNSFYTTSMGGRAERTTFRQKKSPTDVVVTPVERMVTLSTGLYPVMAGKENIADFMGFLLRSVQSKMYGDALNTLNTGLAAIPAGTQNVTGAFDLATLVQMAETVQYRNGGVRPVICGSATALMNIVPDATLGYRTNVDGDGGKIELIRNVLGFDIMRLDNAVSETGSLLLPTNKIYVVSPSQDKLVKGVMTTSMSNTNQFFDNADLTSNYTYRREWNFIFASAAQAGIYTVTNS